MTRMTTGVPSRSAVSMRKSWSGSLMADALVGSVRAHGLREEKQILRVDVDQPVARTLEVGDQAARDRDRDRKHESDEPSALRALDLEADEQAAEEREPCEQRPRRQWNPVEPGRLRVALRVEDVVDRGNGERI